MDLFNKKKLAEVTQQLANANQTLHQRDVLANALGVSHSGQRDIYDIYGYPQHTRFSTLYQYSRRMGIANRIVFGMPKSCWSDGFEICQDVEEEKPILEDMKMFWDKHTKAIERADALNRVGKFSALFVGVPDGQEPKEPLGRVMGNAIESIYLRPYAYDGIEIYQWDSDPMSPRFGLPDLYQLQVIGRGDNEKDPVKRTVIAHWSRVIHIVETQYDSEVEGVPALEPIFNRILDIDKATGGSAEAYFRNARARTAFEIDKEFAPDLLNNPEAKQAFDDSAKQFTNGWQDQIIAIGAKATTHNPTLTSPIDTIRAALWDIAGQTRYPIRLLTGEGSGQLAGSEDKLAYNVLVQDRRDTFCTPIVKRLLSILSECGAIKLPNDYYIKWNKQDATTEAEEADIGLKRAQTLSALATAKSQMGGDAIDMESALGAVYLGDVDINDVELDYYGEESDQDSDDREVMAEGNQPPMGDTE